MQNVNDQKQSSFIIIREAKEVTPLSDFNSPFDYIITHISLPPVS